jgi:hypothetical protein
VCVCVCVCVCVRVWVRGRVRVRVSVRVCVCKAQGMCCAKCQWVPAVAVSVVAFAHCAWACARARQARTHGSRRPAHVARGTRAAHLLAPNMVSTLRSPSLFS